MYASWDGDTQVVGWRVLAGSSAQSLKSVATKAKNGFETTIPLSNTYKAYEVQALGPKGKVLGTSKAFPTQSSSNGLPGDVLIAASGAGPRELSGRAGGSWRLPGGGAVAVGRSARERQGQQAPAPRPRTEADRAEAEA